VTQRSTASSHDSVKGIIMNVKQLAAAVSLFTVAAAAMASEATQWNPPAGHLSRAEVKAELLRAEANGEVARGEAYDGYDYSDTRQSTVTRAEVKQELARAIANGELEQRGETYGSFTEPRPHATDRAFAWRKPHQEAKSPTKRNDL